MPNIALQPIVLCQAAPAKTQQSILDHVGKMTWADSVWTEDLLASKKIYPGFTFTAKCKQWASANRLRTTEQSMDCFVTRLQTCHEGALPNIRRRLDTATAEQVSERAALLVAVAHEVQAATPIRGEVLEKGWLLPWANGCHHIDGELQVLLACLL